MSFFPKKSKQFSREELSSLLEISSPFLLLDNLVIKPKTQLYDWQAVGQKQLNTDDWFFACHLPSTQTMPATLVTECMLQTLVGLIYCSIDHSAHRSFVTDLSVKLNRGATSTDLLTFKAQLLSSRRGIFKGKVQTLVNEQPIAEGEFQYASPHLIVSPKL